MIKEVFFDNFDILAEAPGGVAKLRELILELAVRGKLVEQKPEDEPASVLLEYVRAEKDLRLKRGGAKGIGLKETVEAKPPYELPISWKWARFSDVALIATNLVQPQKYNTLPHIAPDNIEKQTGRLLEFQTIAEDGVSSPKHRFFPGQILYSKIRPNLAKVVIVDFEGLCSADMYPIDALVDAAFLWKYMLSGVFLSQSVKNDTRVAMPKINQEELNKILVPVPPLAEQRRIVAKVDQLMALCDELEARQERRRAARQRLNDAALDALLAARDPGEFAACWRRIRDSFDLLYDTPETVGKLRQAILLLAVQGRISQRESYKLSPNGHKVADFVRVQNGYAFKSEWFASEGIRLVRNINVGHGTLQWDDVARIPTDRKGEFDRFALKEGDIVISLDRPLISTGLKAARIGREDLPSLLLQRVGRFEFKSAEIDPDFFFLWLHSPIFKNAIDPGRSKGVPHISSKEIEALPFTPPPIEIQVSTVSTLKILMALCDDLETKLKDTQAASARLLDSVVRTVLTAEPAASGRRNGHAGNGAVGKLRQARMELG